MQPSPWILLVVLPLVISTPCMGDTATFGAKVTPVSLTSIKQSQRLNFGRILNYIGASCRMNETNELSGACTPSGSNATPGQIIVSGLPANRAVSVKVQGSRSAALIFLALAKINGAIGAATQIGDGQTHNFLTTNEAGDISLRVYGELALTQELPLEVAQSISYSVTINIE